MEIYNYITVGLISFDEIIKNTIKRQEFGGSVIYSSIQAKKLNLNPLIISLIGKDKYKDLIKLLSFYKISYKMIKPYNEKTLTFKNIYINNEKRKQRIENFYPINLTLKFLKLNFAECLHVGSIINEFNLNELKTLRNKFYLIALDAQGYCRQIKNSKKIVPKIWSDSLKFFRFIDILKFDLDELYLAFNTTDLKNILNIVSNMNNIILITLGKIGSFLLYKNLFFIPSFEAEKEIDPTGAGDVFLSSFLIHFLKTKDYLRSALFASCASSFVVEDFGVNSIANLNKIKLRMKNQNKKYKKITYKEALNIISIL